jgi:hypothetical protein
MKENDNFIKLFKTKNSEYYDYVPLSDVNIGFSVKRNYPKQSYKSPVDMNDNPDVCALIHVRDNESSKNGEISLAVRITAYSKWDTFNIMYDFDNPECPTKESLIASKSFDLPRKLVIFGYYVKNKKLYNSNDKEIKGYELLNQVFKKHIETL